MHRFCQLKLYQLKFCQVKLSQLKLFQLQLKFCKLRLCHYWLKFCQCKLWPIKKRDKHAPSWSRFHSCDTRSIITVFLPGKTFAVWTPFNCVLCRIQTKKGMKSIDLMSAGLIRPVVCMVICFATIFCFQKYLGKPIFWTFALFI